VDGPAPIDAAEGAYNQGLEAKERGDDAGAARLFESAATRGHAAAAFELGQAYSAGRGVPKALNLAAEWFDRSARLGDPSAQFPIGAIRFADDEYEAARPWLVAAGESGDPRAQNLLGEMYMNGWGVPVDQAWRRIGMAWRRARAIPTPSSPTAWPGWVGWVCSRGRRKPISGSSWPRMADTNSQQRRRVRSARSFLKRF
jgi:hypothetical protein